MSERSTHHDVAWSDGAGARLSRLGTKSVGNASAMPTREGSIGSRTGRPPSIAGFVGFFVEFGEGMMLIGQHHSHVGNLLTHLCILPECEYS